VVLEYNSKEIAKGPTHISQWIPILAKTAFAKVIDCAFDTEGNEAFIFSGKLCAKINYTPDSLKAKIISSPAPINVMFPYLTETPFEDGIDAAIRSRWNEVILFRGDKYAIIDYKTEKLIVHQSIANGFGSLVGTVFEHGIDAAFSMSTDVACIFKGKYYALIKYAPYRDDSDYIYKFSRIKIIKKDWTFLDELLEEDEI
jgi:hypothetical protein